MSNKEYKLAYLDNGVIIVGEVVKETKTLLSLSYPCIVMFVDEKGNPALQLSLLPEPNLTDERVFEIETKKLLFKSQKPRDRLIEVYSDFVSKQKDLDANS